MKFFSVQHIAILLVGAVVGSTASEQMNLTSYGLSWWIFAVGFQVLWNLAFITPAQKNAHCYVGA